MISRSSVFSVLQICSAFILLIYPPASSANPDQWFLNCQEFVDCKKISTTEFRFWRSERTETCSPADTIKLKCDGSRTATIEILGAEFELLGFNTNHQIFLMAENYVSSRLCSHDRSSYIYGIIPLSENCEQPIKTHCSDSESRFRYLALENNVTAGGGNANYPTYCRVSVLVYISRELLTEVGDLQRALLRIREKFESEPKLEISCASCTGPDVICGYDLLYERVRCFCKSISDRLEVCLSDGTILQYPPSKPGKQVLLKKVLIIGVAFASCCILMIISLIIYIYNTRRSISKKYNVEEIIKGYSTQTPKRFSYSNLIKLTNSFNNKLGEGGFSTVYKGKLASGRDVAVKLLNETKENDRDFMNEVVNITRTSHINIVSLLGFCCEHKKRALIYEYMPKGSLDKYIWSRENEMKLDLKTMYNIVIGIARGLEYLHCGCNTRIVHFDIKPHNILLDNDFCPKISDFGLAKQCRARESHVSMTGMKGTIGFMAPEIMFRSFGWVSHKSDVYSFGMLILTMVGEGKSFEKGVEESSQELCFPIWMYDDLTQSEIDKQGEEEEMARKMIIVGLCCIQTLPEERPSMSEVVAKLEGSVDGLQIPPRPTLFGHPGMPQPSSSSISLCRP